ncbi:type IV toxin-antitoxin system AbiEi family antitoxin [Jonesiaceae bacterium BS-20]|uniref:Type IV toxin-antitoxin system AbiEi family antitoxin n=1 Tax=Jonesiaceae bacterium BS-20 TaxID=3120821 RepID=A0AAU7DZM0_9MICO
MKESLAKNLADRFDEFGLALESPLNLGELLEQSTAHATIAHKHGSANFTIAYSPSMTGSTLEGFLKQSLTPERLLLLGPRITERSATLFRELGICYLDQSGNAFITFDGVHLDVRGRRAPTRNPSLSDAPMHRGGVNLFSPKRAQVIFAILTWPDLLHGPVRNIATTSGVSLGQAQRTLDLLSQYGFIDETRSHHLHSPEQLINLWVAAYPSGLGSSKFTKYFSGPIDDLISNNEAIYISGEAAVPELLRPETLLLYSTKAPTDLIRSHRWRHNDDQPNIFLREKFWQAPREADSPGIYSAPWLLVYSDLLASGDDRQREAAEIFLKEATS